MSPSPAVLESSRSLHIHALSHLILLRCTPRPPTRVHDASDKVTTAEKSRLIDREVRRGVSPRRALPRLDFWTLTFVPHISVSLCTLSIQRATITPP